MPVFRFLNRIIHSLIFAEGLNDRLQVTDFCVTTDNSSKRGLYQVVLTVFIDLMREVGRDYPSKFVRRELATVGGFGLATASRRFNAMTRVLALALALMIVLHEPKRPSPASRGAKFVTVGTSAARSSSPRRGAATTPTATTTGATVGPIGTKGANLRVAGAVRFVHG
jgi:hypothetical protein